MSKRGSQSEQKQGWIHPATSPHEPTPAELAGSGGEGENQEMGQRGINRPQMESGAGTDGMSEAERRELQREHHRKTLWIYWTIIALGLWMIASALTFGHGSGIVEVAGDRWLPWERSTSVTLMVWSDLLSGALLILFGTLSLNPFRPWALWGAATVGAWLNFAPLLFWSPTAWGYLNDSIVGTLVIALAILIPGMPWMIMMMKPGPTVPQGWSYNPSSWPQRWIMIALGFVGWLVSRYLGAYQLGYIQTIWEPFFGSGSARVLTSRVSEFWPISDGGLGAFAYTFEFLMGWMGSPKRWRTMPWMVTFFGILVIPLGLTHIFLVISQPVLVGEWCTFCLLAAAIMLPMIPLEVDEVIAMGQFLWQTRRAGKPFWRTFWKGGTAAGEGEDERSPSMIDAPAKVIPAMFWGMSVPWTLVVTTLVGLWLMATPSVLGSQGTMADSFHLVGALIVVNSVIAMGEPVRALRFLNVLLGLWLVIAPWLLDGTTTLGTWNSVVAGIATAVLSLPRGPIKEKYGAWDRFVV